MYYEESIFKFIVYMLYFSKIYQFTNDNIFFLYIQITLSVIYRQHNAINILTIGLI